MKGNVPAAVFPSSEYDPDTLDRSSARRGTPVGVRILAVEDSPSARQLLQAILLKLGVTLPDLRLASNVSEALQVFTQWRPEVVFVDMELKAVLGASAPPTATGAPPPSAREVQMNGPELAVHMLERNPQLKLIVCTAADPQDPRVVTVMKRGAQDVIVKPVTAARVEEVLKRVTAPRAPSPNAARRR